MNQPRFTPDEVLEQLLATRNSRPRLQDDFAAPINEMESRVAGIWSEVLKTEKVGRLDNFFSLGGDSLNMIQVMNRIHRSLEVEIEFGDFFENLTVAALAEHINAIIKNQNSAD